MSCFREEGVASEDEGFVGVASREEGLVGAITRAGFGCVAYKEVVGVTAISGLWRATMSWWQQSTVKGEAMAVAGLV